MQGIKIDFPSLNGPKINAGIGIHRHKIDVPSLDIYGPKKSGEIGVPYFIFIDLKLIQHLLIYMKLD